MNLCCSVIFNILCVIIYMALQPIVDSASSLSRLQYHTQLHTTLGRTPLDEWSARRRDLHLTTHTTHKRKTSISPVGFEPTIPINERLQTHILDRAATGIGVPMFRTNKYNLTQGKGNFYLMDAIPLCDIIKVYTNIYVNTQQYCLTQFYYYLERGDMFRLLIQPSSVQLTIEQDL